MILFRMPFRKNYNGLLLLPRIFPAIYLLVRIVAKPRDFPYKFGKRQSNLDFDIVYVHYRQAGKKAKAMKCPDNLAKLPVCKTLLIRGWPQ